MPASTYNILFVDDEENNLIAFKNAFFRHYNIHTASSAIKGLEILEKHTIHLVITDQRMPQISGLEFLQIVKEKYPLAIRMIITGYSDVEVIMRAFNELDIFHYALKPWNNLELKIIMDNALNKYQLTSDNACLIGQLQQANETLEDKVKLRTEQLAQKNKEYIQLNEVKDKLFSIVSHDLRGPLASLSAFVDMFLKYQDIFTAEESNKTMQNIQHSLQDLTEMLNNLLSWTQAQLNNTDPILETQLLCQTITKIYEPYKQMAAQKNILLQTQLLQPDLEAKLDANLTAIILRNLISNAIKFTPTAGMITISVSSEGSFARVSVSDTGLGIAKENLHKLFSNEHLFTSLGTANEKGTGLGLKLCREYAEKQGGSMGVVSEINKGSTFYFTVPLQMFQ